MASRKRKETPQLGLGLPPPTSASDPHPPPECHPKPAVTADSARDEESGEGQAGEPRRGEPRRGEAGCGETWRGEAGRYIEVFDTDDFDDYDENAVVNGTPRLRLLDPPVPGPSVIVEVVDGGYEVSRLRDNGTTVAAVRWTRTELEELVSRARAALEVKP